MRCLFLDEEIASEGEEGRSCWIFLAGMDIDFKISDSESMSTLSFSYFERFLPMGLGRKGQGGARAPPWIFSVIVLMHQLYHIIKKI